MTEIIGYIDINNLKIIGKLYKKKMKNGNYFEIMNQDKTSKNIYLTLKTKLEKYNYQNKNKNQNGSSYALAGTIFGVSSGILTTSIIGYIIYRILVAPTCRDSYPTYDKSENPDIKDIVMLVVPSYLIPNYENLDINNFFINVKSVTDAIKIPIQIISPDSSLGQVASDVLDIGAGIAITALTAATAGLAAPVNYMIKFINFTKEALGLLFKLLEALEKLADVMTNDDSIKMIYDLLNVDFRDGPFGVTCWVNHIINKYGMGTEIYKSTCELMNKLLDIIYDKLIRFISKAMSFAIPDGGIAGTLFSNILKFMKSGTFSFALAKMTEAYDKMSYDMQLLFEKPLLLKSFLEDILKSTKYYIESIDANIYEKLFSNTALFSISINKMMALVFVFLNIFSLCSK